MLYSKLLPMIIISIGINFQVNSLTFNKPKHSDIIGNLQVAKVQAGESLADIGRRFDLGIYEMIEANPNIDPWSPKHNTKVIIPTQFILPPGEQKGMVINLAEMRIYYYHGDKNHCLITTHPIGIGKKGWATPIGKGIVTHKKKNPSWRPPKSIRAAHAKQGNILPRIVPPGPNNPLGEYAMRLSIPGYLIHGTNRPGGIGVRSSSGCIRMFPEDIKSFFYQVPIRTPVRIIHAPYKFGIHRNKIYVEAHEPLSDPYYRTQSDEEVIVQALEEAAIDELNWESTKNAILLSNGYPILVN